MISETMFCKQLVHSLKGAGAMTFNVHGHQMQAPGWPDLQVYHPWWTGHLELKVAANTLTPLQAERIRRLKYLRTPAAVLRLHPHDEKLIRLENEDGAILATSDHMIFKWRHEGEFLVRWLAKHVELPRFM